LARGVLLRGEESKDPAMLITVRGRIEMDPLQVPQAASMATGTDSFEQVLQETVAADEEPAAPPEADAEEPADAPAAAVPAEPRPERAPDDEPPARASAVDSPTDTPVVGTCPGPVAEATDSIRRGEPGRQETAGKGTDSPRTSSSGSEPLLAAFLHQRAVPTNGPLVAAASTTKVDGVRGVRGADGNGRGALAIAEAKASAALKTPATAASYRTSGAATAELLEQARDSVFKQILMKLDGDRGEMRLRLEPPDLGELDLRLLADGNKLQLAIAAERQDVADLLQRHLDSLQQSLAAAGLELTDASVQTRSEFARDQQARDARDRLASDASPGESADDDTTSTTPVRHGYVSASGLDFWA
jgi:hypothetical protein